MMDEPECLLGNTFTELTRHTKGVGTAIWVRPVCTSDQRDAELFGAQNMLSHDVSKGIIAPLFAATAPIALDMNGKVSLRNG